MRACTLALNVLNRDHLQQPYMQTQKRHHTCEILQPFHLFLQPFTYTHITPANMTLSLAHHRMPACLWAVLTASPPLCPTELRSKYLPFFSAFDHRDGYQQELILPPNRGPQQSVTCPVGSPCSLQQGAHLHLVLNGDNSCRLLLPAPRKPVKAAWA